MNVNYMEFISWLLQAGKDEIINFESLENSDKLSTYEMLELAHSWLLSSNWKTSLIRLDALRFIKVFTGICGIEFESINGEFEINNYM